MEGIRIDRHSGNRAFLLRLSNLQKHFKIKGSGNHNSKSAGFVSLITEDIPIPHSVATVDWELNGWNGSITAYIFSALD